MMLIEALPSAVTLRERTRLSTTSRTALLALVLLTFLFDGSPPGPVGRAYALGGGCAAASQVTYVNDPAGRLIAAVDLSTGNAATYSYDKAGNLTKIGSVGPSTPSILAFTPNNGPVAMTVTIYGDGFSCPAANNTVKFNGSTGTAATVLSATLSTLTVTVPSGAASGPIYVSSNGGSATSSASFTITAN